MNKSTTMILSSLMLIGLIATGCYLYSQKTFKYLPTYFPYTQVQNQTLHLSPPSYFITLEDLQKWDQISYDLIRSNKLGDADSSKLFAYLYNAQRDVAFLSYNAKRSFKGSIDPISAEILCLFFTNECIKIKQDIINDDYSNQLAKLVLAQVIQRMTLDKLQTHRYASPINSAEYWQGLSPFYGQTTGSWKTWLIHSGDQFKATAPKPPKDIFWQTQMHDLNHTLANVSEEQKLNVVFWASGPGTITLTGKWLDIANTYMAKRHLSLQDYILMRSVLAMGLADSVICAFDSIYSYWIKRPYMLDSNINPLVPTPNRPSYPSAHSAISGTAMIILSYYFPQNSAQWLTLARFASQSGLYGGMHFPIDIEQGFIQGIKIGNFVIRTEENLK